MTRYLHERTLFGPLIGPAPAAELGLVVVIPAKDEPDLQGVLQALRDCAQPTCAVEVVVVVNTSEADAPDCVAANQEIARRAGEWAREASEPSRQFFILECLDLPKKHAGVGLARKTGMDEACRRLESVGCSRGVIACFDADSSCDRNYLVEVESLFRRKEHCQACSIYFEHPLVGEEHAPAVYQAIAQYELHLRYYVRAQRWAGFPFAIQTIGSSMAVRCDAYQAQNGMNKRQAGEDFYFLHKFTPLGKVEELKTTRVIPSPRPSHRVPFGTGKAVGEQLACKGPFLTYHPRSFADLRDFFAQVDRLRTEGNTADFPESVRCFLEPLDFQDLVQEIRANVTSNRAFRVRFFRWFNAFLVMKYLHFARERFYPDQPVEGAASWLLDTLGAPARERDRRELLMVYRRLDRSSEII